MSNMVEIGGSWFDHDNIDVVSPEESTNGYWYISVRLKSKDNISCATKFETKEEAAEEINKSLKISW